MPQPTSKVLYRRLAPSATLCQSAGIRLRASLNRRQAWSPTPLFASKRFLSMPDPADLFTSPAGLMALLYGRTGSSASSNRNSINDNNFYKESSTAAFSENKRRVTGKAARRARQQQRQHNSPGERGQSSTSEENNDNQSSAPSSPGLSSSFFNTQALVLALAIFVLSALWDLFTSQKSTLWTALKNSVATTLEVRSSAQEFAMIVDWMGRQPHGQRIRNLSLKPVTVQDEQKTIWGPQETAADDASSSADADPRVMLVPGYGSHLFRFGTTWVYITRSEDPSKQKAAAANRVDRENDKLTLTFLTRRRAVVQQFMSHVRQSWSEHVRNTVHIYLSEGYSARWRLLSERLRRPLTTLYLPAETKAIVEEARLFLGMKSTYAALGIPWRRGYLLEGPPGTGKSSFVMALAGELGLPLHILSLRSDNMDDDALLSLVSGLPPRSILLIEDFENALKANHSVTATPATAAGEGEQEGASDASAPAAPAAAAAATSYSTDVGGGPRSALSLSALLNALDGVSSSEGRLLLITANDTSKIPFAETLLRPGRIDRRVAFEALQPQQVAEMEASFQRTLQASLPAIAETAVAAAHDATSQASKEGPSAEGNTPACTPALYQQRLLNSIYASSLQEAKALAEQMLSDAPTENEKSVSVS